MRAVDVRAVQYVCLRDTPHLICHTTYQRYRLCLLPTLAPTKLIVVNYCTSYALKIKSVNAYLMHLLYCTGFTCD